MRQNILLAGASGCVGHYLVEELAQRPEYQVYLLVRNRARLRFAPEQLPNCQILEADLGDWDRYRGLLAEMDYVINVAAAWGDPDLTEKVNVTYPLRLYEHVHERCQKIIHFSTASILGRDNQLLEAAKTLGTDYVRTKYLCYEQISQLRTAAKITTLCPTLILGGDKDKPYSHVCGGLPNLVKWMGWIQWIRSEGSFHFIHARDIARIVCHLMQQSPVDPLLVLGNPNITINECIERACKYLGHNAPLKYDLSLSRARQLVKWLPISMAPWDEFCMDYRDFRYRSVNAATFGLPVVAGTVEEVLGMYGYPS